MTDEQRKALAEFEDAKRRVRLSWCRLRASWRDLMGEIGKLFGGR